MVQVNVSRGLDGKFQKMTQQLEEVGQIYARKFSENLVKNSPVDTGTFMESYYVSNTYSGGSTSSSGKPRNQPYEQFAQAALGRMGSQIASLKGTTQMVFGNEAEHAMDVEYKHGYAPFGTTRNLHRMMLQEAWQESGLAR
jgi:hypothetical protein